MGCLPGIHRPAIEEVGAGGEEEEEEEAEVTATQTEETAPRDRWANTTYATSVPLGMNTINKT